MKNIVIYVHGKGGSAAEAEHYRQLFPDSEVIGFDYHAQTPWEAKEEFPEFFRPAAEALRSSHTGSEQHRRVFLAVLAGWSAG